MNGNSASPNRPITTRVDISSAPHLQATELASTPPGGASKAVEPLSPGPATAPSAVAAPLMSEHPAGRPGPTIDQRPADLFAAPVTSQPKRLALRMPAWASTNSSRSASVSASRIAARRTGAQRSGG